MTDLHPEVLKMIEAGPQRINRADSSYVDANYVKETPEEFASRIALRAVELERELNQGWPQPVLTFCNLLVPDDSPLLDDEAWVRDAVTIPNEDGNCPLVIALDRHVAGMDAINLAKQRAIRRRGKP